MSQCLRFVSILVGILAFTLPTQVLNAKVKSSFLNNTSLGINLSGPADWNTELPFVDVFRLSRKWISQEAGKGWGKGPRLQLDKHGWVKTLEENCYAEALLCWIDGNHYPSGNYVVIYEGEGMLKPTGAASLVSRKPGRLIINVDASKGGFTLRLTKTNTRNPLRNIHVIMPGYEKTFKQQPFHPAFLKRWKSVSCITHFSPFKAMTSVN